MEWLKPAMVSVVLASAVLAGTFFYVWWFYIRRRFVLLWSLAWLAGATHIGLGLVLPAGVRSHLPWTADQVLLIVNALFVLAGCYEFVHRRLPLGTLAAFGLPFVSWAVLAPFFSDGFLESTLPSALLLGSSYLFTATRFVLLRRDRGTRGARVLAILFVVAGVHEFDYPLLGNSRWGAPVGYTVAAVTAIVIAMFLLVMVLEESRGEAESQRLRTRAILENLPVGVLVTDPGGRIGMMNPVAKALLAHEADAPVQDLPAMESRVFRDRDLQALQPEALPAARALHTGEPTRAAELAMRDAKGDWRTVLVNATAVRDEQDKLLGAVVVLQDIEDLKKLQAEMARGQRLEALGTLAAGVAHDVNNALTIILGHTELAQEAVQDAAVREHLGLVSQVARDCTAFARRIQDVARTDGSKENVPLDLAEIVREVVEITRPRWHDEARARGLSYTVTTELERGTIITGQPAELREALLNLLFNALDAMPAGGALHLEAARRGSEAVVTIRDTGVGMSAKVRERIFEPFFTTKGQRGTGLGLAVVFGIVRRHEGRITTTSQPGQGTTFEMRFPLQTGARDPGPAEETPAPSCRLAVLVVDDEALVRNLLAKLLRLDGHEVAVASGGAEALALLKENPFDLLITDVGMPGMTGHELSQAARMLRPEIAIVLVTGWGETLAGPGSEKAGIAAILGKPFSHAQLRACLRRAAATSRLDAPVQATV